MTYLEVADTLLGGFLGQIPCLPISTFSSIIDALDQDEYYCLEKKRAKKKLGKYS